MNPDLAAQWQAASITSCSATSEVFVRRSGIQMMEGGQILSESVLLSLLYGNFTLRKTGPFLFGRTLIARKSLVK